MVEFRAEKDFLIFESLKRTSKQKSVESSASITNSNDSSEHTAQATHIFAVAFVLKQ